VLGVFAVLILIAAIVISQSGSDDSDSSDGGDGGGDTSAQVEESLAGIPQDGVLLGDAGAPERVVEFVDLQCPFCAEFSTGALPQVIDENVRSGEIAYELRVISFLGADSEEAAYMAAAATMQNRLFEFAETFYLNQGEENSGYVTEEFLTEIAEQTPGLDAEQALADQDSPEAQAIVDENEAEAQRLGVGGTPTFILVAGEQTAELGLTELTADAFSSALDSARSGG
jgi:protein-disulfide isomerase